MSELREGIFRAGNCVEDAAGLFARLDMGVASPKETELAIQECGECRLLGSCKKRLGKTALSLAKRGVAQTIIAGAQFEAPLSANSSRITSSPKSRTHHQDGTVKAEGFRHITTLSESFLATFADSTDPLDTVRHSGLDIRYFLAYRLKPRIEPLAREIAADPPVDITELKEKDRDYACFIAASMVNRIRTSARVQKMSWSDDDQAKTFDKLTTDYLTDVMALHHLQLREAPRLAFLRNPAYYQELLRQYPDIPKGTMRYVFVSSKTPHRMLERYERFLPLAEAALGQSPVINNTQLRTLTLVAARSEDPKAMQKTIENYLQKYKRVEQLGAHMSFLSPARLKELAINYTNPEKAVSALEDRVTLVRNLAQHYNLPERSVYFMAVRYSKDLEGKLRRYRDVKTHLFSEFRGHPDIKANFIECWALYHPRNTLEVVNKYLHALALLRNQFSDDDDFDPSAIQMLAFRRYNTPEKAALSYKNTYAKLRQTHAYSDFLEDWMFKHAAIFGLKRGHLTLKLLQSAIKRGLLRVSLDAPAQGTEGLALNDKVKDDAANPEERFIASENAQQQRIAIQGALLQLSRIERDAVIHSFGLDWLLGDQTIIDREALAHELGIPLDDFDQYVAQTILPKLHISELRDLL